MARSSIWDGAQWVSMTGGSGEDSGGGTPDDDYLRLDGANNPASPNDFIRSGYVDGVFLPLSGGTLTGVLTMKDSIYIAFDWDGGVGFNIVGDGNGDLQFRRGQTAWMKLAQSDTEHVRLYRELQMGGNRISGLGNPAADDNAMPRSYADGRYATVGHGHSDPVGLLVGGAYHESNSTLTDTSAAVQTAVIATVPGQTITVFASGVMRSGAMNPGDMIHGNIRIDGSSYLDVIAGIPALSQAAHTHTGPSHDHSSASHSHSSASHSHTDNSRNTDSALSGANLHSHAVAYHSTNSTTPGSTGSTTPNRTGASGTGSTSSATPAVNGASTAMSVTPLGARTFTPTGSSITIDLMSSKGGSPGQLRSQLVVQVFSA